MTKGTVKSNEEFKSQFKNRKPEVAPLDWASDVIQREKHINETKKDVIQDIQYVTKCETCESNKSDNKQNLEAKIREL